MRLCIILLCCLFVQPLFAADWPRFRGPNGGASSTDPNLPLKWSGFQWRTELPGPGSSSPVVLGERIFLTYFSGYGVDPDNPGDHKDLRLHVLCLNRQDGNMIWERSTPASSNEQKFSKRVADHGYATPTAACDESGVYAYFGVSGVVAYDLQGKLKWRFEQTGEKTAGFGNAASPVIYKNLVLVNASIESGTLFALDKNTGKEVWRAENIQRSWSTPTIAASLDGKDELIMNQKEAIYGFDPLSGEKLWTCRGIQDYVVPCVVVDQGIAYCLGGRSNRAIAVKLGGRGDVTETHKLWEKHIGANVTSPVYWKGHLYWASDKGIANCLRAEDGEIVYRERLPVRGRIYASIIIGDGKIYCTTRDQGVIVLKAAPDYQLLAQNVFDGDENLFNASPAISRGQLLFRNHQYLYCIGNKADSGK